MIPGANLLAAALRAVEQQSVLYFRDAGRETAETGRDVARYCPPMEMDGCSVQPVPGAWAAKLGLDAQKHYVTWWVRADALGAGRGISGDMIEYGGSRWQCQSETDWFGQDGWKEVVCVRVGRARQ